MHGTADGHGFTLALPTGDLPSRTRTPPAMSVTHVKGHHHPLVPSCFLFLGAVDQVRRALPAAETFLAASDVK